LEIDGVPTGAEITIDLRKRLYQGEWDVGEQIPPLAELAEHYQSSMAMMRRAQAPLIAEGWLRPQQGLGVYVAVIPSSEVAADKSRESAMTSALAAIDTAITALAEARRTLSKNDE
jgi:DNA-binding GntR family transcriptional regulator